MQMLQQAYMSLPSAAPSPDDPAYWDNVVPHRDEKIAKVFRDGIIKKIIAIVEARGYY